MKTKSDPVDRTMCQPANNSGVKLFIGLILFVLGVPTISTLINGMPQPKLLKRGRVDQVQYVVGGFGSSKKTVLEFSDDSSVY